MKQVLTIFLFLYTGVVFAQTSLDSLQQLDEIVLHADRVLKMYSKTQKVSTLKDSTLTRSASSLTDLLNQNSLIYFKENGLGMVSSASFRGSSASQTAVVWNGININSQFNGQTDFNTVNILSFDEVSVRSGGGSVLYGSGAIGGSVHLNNVISFNNGFKNKLLARYGSFNTQDIGYAGAYSDQKLSAEFSVNYSHSDNDYKYVDSDRRNLNGQFYNVGLSATLGYRISEHTILKYYGNVYDSERHFSLIIPTETPTRYKDFNTRHLLEWNGFYGKYSSTLKLAYLRERYRYFASINSDNYTFGEAKTAIGKYQLGMPVFKNAYLEGIADITHMRGKSSSVGEEQRTISGFSLLFKQQLGKFYYEATVRQEITSNYDSPVLFSLGFQYEFGAHYVLSVNGSKNFRIPTYNDLYWAGSGNSDLDPETSYQLELNNAFEFENIEFSITAFYNDINEMIRWIPSGSVWIPTNADHLVSYGLEAHFKIRREVGKHQFVLDGNYGYTVSEDQQTNNQLTYVPKHKATGQFNYKINRLSAYWQALYTGEVFLLSGNNPEYVIDAYSINNLGVEYNVGKQKQIVLGARVRNVFNLNYESMDNRFMPGINYNFYLNLNF